MSAITINGDLVHYEVLGRGRPVVLLHSWLGSWRYWVPAMQQLSVKYRTYAVDLWGFGGSGKNKFYYSIDGQVDTLQKFIDRMGIPKAVFVGHGLGAAVAAHFAVKPESSNIVHRLITIAPPLLGTKSKQGPSANAPAPPPPVPKGSDAPTLLRPSKAGRERLLQAAQAQGLSAAAAEPIQSNTSAPEAPPPQPASPSPMPLAAGANAMSAMFSKSKLTTILGRHMDTSSSDYQKLLVEVEKAADEAARVSAQSLNQFNPFRNLMQAKALTLAIYGESDTFIPADETLLQQIKTTKPEFRSIVLSDARHFPMLEDTTRFIRILRSFMEAPTLAEFEVKAEWRRRTR